MNKIHKITKKKLGTKLLCFLLLAVMLTGSIVPVYAAPEVYYTPGAGDTIVDSGEAKEENDDDDGSSGLLQTIIGILTGKSNKAETDAQHTEQMTDASNKHTETTDNIKETTATTIRNEQKMLDEQLGEGGYSNTDIMSIISDVPEIKASIDNYMSVKYMTEDDIEYIKLAMYLSQFATPLSENLLNVINRIQQEVSGDTEIDLNQGVAESISGDSVSYITKADGSTLTFNDLFSHIKENYYVTNLYKSLDGGEFEAATVADLFYGKPYKFYIKDTYYIPQSTDFIAETDDAAKDVSTMDHTSSVTVRTALSNAYSGDSRVLLPFLDKSIRTGGSSYEISNITLTQVDTYQCVLSNSLAVQTALTAVLTEYERLNPEFNEKNMTDAMGAFELGMDSYGNIISMTNNFIVLNAMMNPTLMATDNNEKINLAAYNYKSAWADVNTANFDKVYIRKNSGTDKDIKSKSYFASKIFKLTEPSDETKDAYFIWDLSESIKGMDTGNLINKDINPARIFKSFPGTNGTETDRVMFMFRGKSNVLNERYESYLSDTPGYYVRQDYTYTILMDDNISTEGSIADYTSHEATYVQNEKNNKSYKFKYYTTPQKIDGVELPRLKDITAKEIIGLINTYSANETLDDIYMFKDSGWTTYKSSYQEALSQAAVDRATYVLEQPEDYVCLPNNNVVAPATEEGSTSTGTPVSSVVYLGIILDGEANKNLKMMDRDIKIYPFSYLSGTVEQSVTINYQDLLFSIFRNTNSNNQKLQDLAELSEDVKNELKEVKIMEILNRIYYKQLNPITTISKYIAGLLQSWHMSLSSGNLSSLFYIEKDNMGNWFDRLAIICFTLALIVLTIRTCILLLKSITSKDITFVGVVKATVIAAVLALCPVILLTLMTNGVKYLSDHGMDTASLKYGAVSLEAELQEKAETKDTIGNEELMYFIENFSAKYENLIEMKTMTDEPYLYDTLKLSDVTNKINGAPQDKKYTGTEFVCALEEYYDQSIFYYFLDYYLNLYVSKRPSLSLSDDNWQEELQDSMYNTRGTMESVFSSKNFIYGDTAELAPSKQVVDDVFGLGMLFYVDDSNPEDRGFSYPIEIFDSTYHNTDYLAEPDNTYWSCILNNDVFYKYNQEEVKNTLIRAGKSESEATVISNMPVYNRKVLENYRNIIKSDITAIGQIEVNPIVISSERISKVYNVPVANFTPLEQKIWKVNNNIFDSVNKYFNLHVDNIHDYTDVVQLAAISTYEFNKVFGVSGDLFDRAQVEPISIEKSSLTLDTVFKAIFNNNNRNVATSYDLMYELTLNQNGILTAIVLLITEVVLSIYTFVRMVHLIQIYIMATISCSFAYGWRRNLQNKAWLGLLWQIVYFLGTHSILIFILNLFSNQPLGENAFVFFFLAVGLLVVSVIAVVIEISMIMFVLKHWRDLGGQIVADKATAMVNNLSAAIEDGVDAENATIENATSGAPQISNMDTDKDGRNDIEEAIEANTEALNMEMAEEATPNIIGLPDKSASTAGKATANSDLLDAAGDAAKDISNDADNLLEGLKDVGESIADDI